MLCKGIKRANSLNINIIAKDISDLMKPKAIYQIFLHWPPEERTRLHRLYRLAFGILQSKDSARDDVTR